LLVCGFASGCVGQGLLAATLGALLSERLGDDALGGALGLGVATLTGLLLASRWIADLMAPVLGAFSDAVGRRPAGVAYFGAGAVVLAAAIPWPSAGLLIAAVLAFYLCATGVGVVLHAEAGAGGARTVASYVTASDLGSAVGPNLGWLVLQAGWASGAVFGIGAGVYGVAGMVAWRVLQPTRHTPIRTSES
jgi:MFS family permease